MQISKQALLNAVDVAASTLGNSSSTLNVFGGNFIFWKDMLYSANNELFLWTKIEQQGIIPELFNDPAQLAGKELTALVKNIQNDSITLSMTNNSFYLKSGRITSRFSCKSVTTEQMQIINSPFPEWHPLTDAVKDALYNVDLSGNRTPMAGTFLDGENGYVVSFDGYQVSYAIVDLPFAQPFFLSTSAIAVLQKLGGFSKIGYDGKRVWFSTDDETIGIACCLLANNLFPIGSLLAAIKKVNVQAAGVKEYVLPADLLQAVRRAKAFGTDSLLANDMIDLRLEPNKITILANGNNAEYGEVMGVPDWTDIPEMEFSLSYANLSNVLAKSDILKVVKEPNATVYTLFFRINNRGLIVAAQPSRGISLKPDLVDDEPKKAVPVEPSEEIEFDTSGFQEE